MKILFLSDDFPPNSRGGAEINAFNLAQALRMAGNSVFIITATQDRTLAGKYEYEGLTIHRIYSSYHRFFTHYFAVYNPQIVHDVGNILQEVSPDIVHAHNIHAYLSFYSLKLARHYARGVFLTAHDTMLVSYGKFDRFINKSNLSVPKSFNYKLSFWDNLRAARKRYNPLRNILIRHYLHYTDKIFANTGVLKQMLEANGLTNIEVVHYGTDIRGEFSEESIHSFKNKFGITNKKIILFGGRLSREKGGEVAVRAMRLVVKESPGAVLLVVGKQEEYSRHMTLIAEDLGVERNIVFTGWLGREDMGLAYASADVVITPSIYFDAFNLFNLEAMAAGKPVVGTCFGGTPEIILDGVSGYIVNPFDIEALSSKISDLLKNPKKAENFGKTGYQRYQKLFTMNLQAEKTMEFYRDAVRKNRN